MDVQYQVYANGKWYSWVADFNTKNSNGYAGVIGKPIDMIQMRLVGLKDLKIQYRVSSIGSTSYWDWVTDFNTKNYNGYAGAANKAIDKLQIRIVRK